MTESAWTPERRLLRSKIKETVKKANDWLDSGVNAHDVVNLMTSLAEWAYELGRTEILRDELAKTNGEE